MVVFFPPLYSEKEKRNVLQVLNQLPYKDPHYNIEIVGSIHRSHFIARFPGMYWLRVHIYKKIGGVWAKIINSAHVFLRYKIKKNVYVNPPCQRTDPYLPHTSHFPKGEWEYFAHTLRP
jgi:hypothetical protein